MLKRAFDMVTSAAFLLVFSPLLVFVAIAVFFNMGSPVIYAQTRPGLQGKPFKMFKFRSMLQTKSTNGELLSDHFRLTPMGKFLRSTSLDELPELWNVLKGDMSLVGPRPLLMEYLPLYSPEQARRHDVKPGITGWAQVNGRNALSWDEKFALDVWYVKNRTMKLDLSILSRTVIAVLTRSGISSEGHSTMPRFGGKQGEEQ
jgi:sugar transferase EpsL